MIIHGGLILPCILFQHVVPFLLGKKGAYEVFDEKEQQHNIHSSTSRVCERAFLLHDLWQELLQLNVH